MDAITQAVEKFSKSANRLIEKLDSFGLNISDLHEKVQTPAQSINTNNITISSGAVFGALLVAVVAVVALCVVAFGWRAESVYYQDQIEIMRDDIHTIKLAQGLTIKRNDSENE